MYTYPLNNPFQIMGTGEPHPLHINSKSGLSLHTLGRQSPSVSQLKKFCELGKILCSVLLA